MNITLNNIDDLNAKISVNITAEDYEEKVEKTLSDYRKKASIPGFRPGKVPMGHIKRMYGKAVLVDEINKLISESLVNYIKDENLNVLGEPLPSEESENQEIDWDKQKDFEFTFDIGKTPEFEVKLSKREKITYYELQPEENLIEDTIKNYTYRNGHNESADEIVEADETIKGDLVQLNAENAPLEDGINREEALMSLHVMKDEDIKNTFKNKKIGDIIDFDLKKAYPNNTEIASLLDITKDEAEEIKGNFRFTIKEITKFVPGEINQELFDTIYGEGVVTSEAEFRTKIIDEIKNSFKPQSEYKFMLDAKSKLIEKIGLTLPDEFLKRWIVATNKEITKEQLEKDYELFSKDMQWQLIVDNLFRTNELKIEENDVLNFAKESTRQQFMQYGLSYIPEEQLEKYAMEIVSKPEERRKIMDKVAENKVLETVKEAVKIENKEVSLEEFKKLF